MVWRQRATSSLRGVVRNVRWLRWLLPGGRCSPKLNACVPNLRRAGKAGDGERGGGKSWDGLGWLGWVVLGGSVMGCIFFLKSTACWVFGEEVIGEIGLLYVVLE